MAMKGDSRKSPTIQSTNIKSGGAGNKGNQQQIQGYQPVQQQSQQVNSMNPQDMKAWADEYEKNNHSMMNKKQKDKTRMSASPKQKMTMKMNGENIVQNNNSNNNQRYNNNLANSVTSIPGGKGNNNIGNQPMQQYNQQQMKKYQQELQRMQMQYQQQLQQMQQQQQQQYPQMQYQQQQYPPKQQQQQQYPPRQQQQQQQQQHYPPKQQQQQKQQQYQQQPPLQYQQQPFPKSASNGNMMPSKNNQSYVSSAPNRNNSIDNSQMHNQNNQSRSRSKSPKNPPLDHLVSQLNRPVKTGPFSQKRYVEYNAYTLLDYKHLTRAPIVMGPLGANLGTKEWEEKKQKRERKELYSINVTKDRQGVKSIKKDTPQDEINKLRKKQFEESIRCKTKEYAKIVHPKKVNPGIMDYYYQDLGVINEEEDKKIQSMMMGSEGNENMSNIKGGSVKDNSININASHDDFAQRNHIPMNRIDNTNDNTIHLKPDTSQNIESLMRQQQSYQEKINDIKESLLN